MLNERLTAARRVAIDLQNTEAELESAILHSHRLAMSIIEGRRDARLPISIGQESLAELSRTISTLVEARGSIASAHASLAQDRVNAGLRAYGMGDVSECPPPGGTIIPFREDKAA